MKNVIHRIFAATMAVVLLVTSTSWKVEKHYCMGYLVDISFFDAVDGCGMESLSDSKDSADIMTIPSCCSDEKVIIVGQDIVHISTDDLSLETRSFLFVFAKSFIGLFNEVEPRIVPLKNYLPPILVSDIALLDQTFLI